MALSKQDRALKRALLHLQETTHALSQVIRHRPLKEGHAGISKDDGSRMTPTDVYNLCREMASAYGGTIGQGLMAATKPLYQASQAYYQQSQQPTQQATPNAPQQASPVAGAPASGMATPATESRRPRR